MGISADSDKEHDLSWLDYSYPGDLSADGKTVLFDEEGVGGGARYGKMQELTYTLYIRNTDGSAAVRLGEGTAEALSPDQKWAIAQNPGTPAQFRLLPTKAGESRPLTDDDINHNTARWCPDGKKFVFSGNEPGHGVRLYVQDVDAGKALAITPEGVNGTAFAVSLDGQTVAAIGPDLKGYLYSISGHGEPRLIPGLQTGDLPQAGARTTKLFLCINRAKFPPKSIASTWPPGNEPCGSNSCQETPPASPPSAPFW